MNLSTLSKAACLAVLTATIALPAVADAASIRVRCETRSNPVRSKVSVDGRNVAPNAIYTARVASGTNLATALPRAATGDEVEFDFDSNPADIRAGATRIAATFIRNRSVRAVLLNASGQVVAGPTTASCEAK
jgi:hypothetical protein